MDYRIDDKKKTIYVWSKDKELLEGFCGLIGKNEDTLYWNKRFKTWTISINSKKHKVAALYNLKGYDILNKVSPGQK